MYVGFAPPVPPSYACDEQRFLTAGNKTILTSTARPDSWSGTWIKPPHARMVLIYMAGAGGGGGGGQSAAAGTGRGGGGGGGGAAGICILIPAMFLPNSILVALGVGGAGGAGGAPGVTGTAGGYSGLAMPQYGNSLSGDWLQTIIAGAGGGGGTAGAGGGGGGVGNIGVDALRGLIGTASSSSTALGAAAGGAGSASSAAATSGTHATSSPLWSGSGGAGAGVTLLGAAGGVHTGSLFRPGIFAQGGQNDGDRGEDQVFNWDNGVNFFELGYTGGGAGSLAGTGGAGGNGFFATGGGGGGAGVTGGLGGRGGDGFCFFWSW